MTSMPARLKDWYSAFAMLLCYTLCGCATGPSFDQLSSGLTSQDLKEASLTTSDDRTAFPKTPGAPRVLAVVDPRASPPGVDLLDRRYQTVRRITP